MRLILFLFFLHSFILTGQQIEEISYGYWGKISDISDVSRSLDRNTRGNIDDDRNARSNIDDGDCNKRIENKGKFLHLPKCRPYEYSTHNIERIIKNKFEVPSDLKSWQIKNEIRVENRTEFFLILNKNDDFNEVQFRFYFDKHWRVDVHNKYSLSRDDWTTIKLKEKIQAPTIAFTVKNKAGEEPKIKIRNQEIIIPGYENKVELDDLPLIKNKPINFKVNSEGAVSHNIIKLYSDDVKKRQNNDNSISWNKNKCLFVSAYSNYENQSIFTKLTKPREHSKALQLEMNKWGIDTVSAISGLTNKLNLELEKKFKDKGKDYDFVLVHLGGHGVSINGEHYIVPNNCQTIDEEFKRRKSPELEQAKTNKSEEFKRRIEGYYESYVAEEYIKTTAVFDFIKTSFGPETFILFVVDACRSSLKLPNEIKDLMRGELTNQTSQHEIIPTTTIKDNDNENALLCFITKNGEATNDDGFTTAFLKRLEWARKNNEQPTIHFGKLFLWTENKYSNTEPQGTMVSLSDLSFGKSIKSRIQENRKDKYD